MKKIMIAGFETAGDKYDNYTQAFRMLGAEGFLSLSEDALETADALVLPGSRQDMNPALWGEEDQCSNDINDELDRIQWNLTDLAIDQGKPVLGICRGMQFINVYFGGTLIQDLPCAAYHRAGEPERYHDIYHMPGTFMERLFGAVSEVNTRHHQGLGLIGQNLEALSWWNDGEDSVTEAIRHREYPMLGLQWHPERMLLYGDEGHRQDAEKLLRLWMSWIG
ncbi:MAG: gamma-glutamyl-gamma-aminobutyrate hydrolase family protein [Emergencia sp.]